MHNLSNSKAAKLILRGVWWVGTVASVGTAYGNTAGSDSAVQQDLRYDKLKTFFHSFGCPAPYYVKEYVSAADTYAIDYRLLPAISVVESTCGLYQRQNNRWGWDSCRRGFSSVREGLQYIAGQLSGGHFYKNKTLEEKVHTYNPDPRYARKIKTLMSKIDDRADPVAQGATKSLALSNTEP
jgi:hypothetical protein